MESFPQHIFIFQYKRNKCSRIEHFQPTRANALKGWGAYLLHGKPENSSWKIKWYASFHLDSEYF